MLGFQANRRILALLAAFFFVTTVYFCMTRLSSMEFVDQPIHEAATSSMQPSSPSSSSSPPIKVNSTHGDIKPTPLTLQSILPESHVPTFANKRRLIIIGDIHGMLAPLESLLHKLSFDSSRDHLVSVGDLINKGPDSPAVVSLLMSHGASAVRGNHEDRVLLALADPNAHASKADLATARSLSPQQLAWLASLPAILTVEQLRIHVVHAGMVPGVAPDSQQPWAVMNMRGLVQPGVGGGKRGSLVRRDDDDDDDDEDDNGEKHLTDEQLLMEDAFVQEPLVPVDSRKGERWTKMWNRHQRLLGKNSRWTVVYGHDAKRGYVEERYSFGLDSGCVKGGALTAMVIQGLEDGGWRKTVMQVTCSKPEQGYEE